MYLVLFNILYKKYVHPFGKLSDEMFVFDPVRHQNDLIPLIPEMKNGNIVVVSEGDLVYSLIHHFLRRKKIFPEYSSSSFRLYSIVDYVLKQYFLITKYRFIFPLVYILQHEDLMPKGCVNDCETFSIDDVVLAETNNLDIITVLNLASKKYICLDELNDFLEDNIGVEWKSFQSEAIFKVKLELTNPLMRTIYSH